MWAPLGSAAKKLLNEKHGILACISGHYFLAMGCVIYCSEVTARLAVTGLGLNPARIRSLPVAPVGGQHMWTRLNDRQGRGLALDVALFNASH